MGKDVDMEPVEGMTHVSLVGVLPSGVRRDLGTVFYLKSQAGYQRDEVLASARMKLEEFEMIELSGDMNLILRRPESPSTQSEA